MLESSVQSCGLALLTQGKYSHEDVIRHCSGKSRIIEEGKGQGGGGGSV